METSCERWLSRNVPGLGKAADVGDVTGISLWPDGIRAQASWERLAE
jgi:hypothetical protein